MSRARTAVATEGYLRTECVCGSKGGAYLGHYEVVECKCGRMFWALRPKRNGPLKLFPHPGLPAGHRWENRA